VSNDPPIDSQKKQSNDLTELEKALAEAHDERQKISDQFKSKVVDAFAKKRQEIFEQQAQNNDRDLPPVNKDNLIESKAVIENNEKTITEPSYKVEISVLVLVVVIILGVFVIFQNAGVLGNTKPSFDCSKVKHKTELEICKEPSLAKLDFENAELFKKASNVNPVKAKQILNNSVKNRYKCQSDYNCIKSNFQQSIIDYKAIIYTFNKPSPNKSYKELRTEILSSGWRVYERANKIQGWNNKPYPELDFCYEDSCIGSFISFDSTQVREVGYEICSADRYYQCPNRPNGFEQVKRDVVISKSKSDKAFLMIIEKSKY
jgi:uncharacterized protein